MNKLAELSGGAVVNQIYDDDLFRYVAVEPTVSARPVGVLPTADGEMPVHVFLEDATPIVKVGESWQGLSAEGEALIAWDEAGLAALERHGEECPCRVCVRARRAQERLDAEDEALWGSHDCAGDGDSGNN